MEKKQEFKVNVGGSSIILIIVVFALAIFAVLSIKASNSDLVLAKKTREAIKEYYMADSQAEEYLAEIDQVLQAEKEDRTVMESGQKDPDLLQTRLETLSFQPVLKEEGKEQGTIAYEVTINDYATLQVELTYDLSGTRDSLYDIKTWKVRQEDIGEYDFTDFEFWDGTIDEE